MSKRRISGTTAETYSSGGISSCSTVLVAWLCSDFNILQSSNSRLDFLKFSSTDTHQKRFEGRLHFPSKQILPIDVSKEGMSLRQTERYCMGTAQQNMVQFATLHKPMHTDCPLLVKRRYCKLIFHHLSVNKDKIIQEFNSNSFRQGTF